MSITVTKGNMTTQDVLADEKVVDMRNEFAELDPDDSQFVTLLSKLGSRQAVSTKIEWLEDQLRPRLITLAASAASADTSLTLTSGYGSYVAADDLLRNMTTGEMYHVTGVTTDTIGVDRAVGGVAAASSASTAQLLLVGSAYKQGASYGTSRIVQRVLGYNYTQIQRDPFSFAGTETAIEEYGGRNPMKEQVGDYQLALAC